MNEKVFYSIVTAIVIIGGVGIGVAYHEVPASKGSTSGSSATSLNLVEVMDANYGGSGVAQPRFYEAVNGALYSTANITIPANTKITISITAYDMGNASVDSKYLVATGVVGNEVQVVNSSIAMGDNTSQAWTTNMSSFPASKVLHTFTIIQGSNVAVNIPVMPGFTEIASFYINSTGTYSWQCEAACGTGPSGWSGPMSAPGWMEGTVQVV